MKKIGRNAISFSVDASEIGRAPVDMEKLFPLSGKGFIYPWLKLTATLHLKMEEVGRLSRFLVGSGLYFQGSQLLRLDVEGHSRLGDQLH